MRKIFTIAGREYRAMVGTKAFLFSILMMPLLMFGSILAMDALSNTGEIKDLRIVVIDHTNQLFAPLKLQAETHNRQINHKLGIKAEANGTDDEPGTETSNPASQTQASEDDENGLDSFGSISKGQRYHLELWKGDDITNEDRYALSEQVRQQELYAFLEIPADLLDLELFRQSPGLDTLPVARFYAEDSNFSDARSWM
ncbi:MAG: hypothetical protein ACR2NP_03715, partial [Pirellulaceae bacterium]